MRWLGLALLPMWIGCYPSADFVFVPDETGATDTGAVVDSAAADTRSDAIFPSDDSSMVDTFVPPTDTGPLLGCGATPSVFCRDFEGVTTVASGWDDSYLRGGGVLNLDSTHVRSPSNAMYSFVPAYSSEVSANVHKAFVAPSATRPMALDFWVFFDVIPTGTGPLVTKLTRDAANRGVSLYVGYNTFAVDVNAPTGTMNVKMPGTISAGKWMHVRFETMLSETTTGWFKLYVDDLTTPRLERAGIATTTVTATDTKINVGLYDGSNVTAVKAWFDDVAFFWL